jgi:hypothetical protein
MRQKQFSLFFVIFTLFLFFNLVSCGSNKVFVTSVKGTGDLGSWPDAGGHIGIAAGDAICQARADAAGLTGTYKAWLSTTITDAYCHIHGYTGHVSPDNCRESSLPVAAGPWVRTDGHPFAPTIDKLINDRQVFAPVRYDEYGVLVTGSDKIYYTGTDIDGTHTDHTCRNWTDGTFSEYAVFGSTDGATSGWTNVASTHCVYTNRLLCFQTGTGDPLPPITAPLLSKKVFVTSVKGTGDLTSWQAYIDSDSSATGVEAGDAICQARAAAAALPHATRFKAWLSDDSHDAKDRIALDGPWYRLDGVKVADNRAALIATASTPLFTAIAYTEMGTYIDAQYYEVWTGTNDNGVGHGWSNCHNWSDSTGGYGHFGVVGAAAQSNREWTLWYNASVCNYPSALYCFEDE